MIKTVHHVILKKQDFVEFKEWLNLNMDGLTWQGRFKNEFETFWEMFFLEGTSLREMFERFEYAQSQVGIGSLASWFKWLRNKFINYIFIFKNVSIEQLSHELHQHPSTVATLLYEFWTDEHPHLEGYFSKVFHVGNFGSPNIDVNFERIKTQMNLDIPEKGSRDEDIMPSMEVTLFEEWSKFLKKMKNDLVQPRFSIKMIRKQTNFSLQIKLLQEVSILLILLVVTVFVVRKTNYWYEKSLADKISIYEPNFSWLNKNLVFKSTTKKEVKEFKLNFNEIKSIEKSDNLTELFDPEQYQEETDVELTSFENIPKDIEKADSERSQYEEAKQGPNGLREAKGGGVKVYRVMLTSTNSAESRKKILDLINSYEGKQADKVKLGEVVPGGVYFNVFLPRKGLRDFIQELTKIEKGKIFETQAGGVSVPAGQTRVFIWMKSI